MASKLFYIWWDEFDRNDMPCVCVICGRKKAEWTPHAFKIVRNENMRSWNVTRKTEVPLCKEHSGGWLSTLHARDFDKQGVWIMNPSDDFVAALKKHRKSEIKAFKEEMEEEDLEDLEEHALPPGMRTPPPEPKVTTAQYVGIILIVGFIALVGVAMLGVCVCMGLGPMLGILAK